MPHIIVKVAAGKTEEEKTRLTEDITRDVMKVFHLGQDAVSVAIEEIQQADWMDTVYKTDILPHWDTLYKKPGYGPDTIKNA
ncbi:tautomerase family protein [Puia dinghuensis]|uniref:4-oxalocrotonate tautomerase-like domain-containing protein n=1 Tax=Puia dinghuensis TaxID=1792502 RepID=A0A8J2XQH8_9BACT|nr:tautomerase family protein [Puia dinghuensis]GGA85037.1 hypothetical protein GCM10011511_05080 [Puia dinghuensis]